MEKQAKSNLLSRLSDDEVLHWQQLSQLRRQAVSSGNLASTQSIDKELMQMRAKVWIYNPDLRENFLTTYFQDPPPDRIINGLIWQSQADWFTSNTFEASKVPLWICSGAQDVVPLSQLDMIRSLAPQNQLSIYDDCGHIPWLEHPERFYRDLKSFLNS